MEKFRTLTVLIISWTILLTGTSVLSCPTNCRCRGKAAKCGSGFSSFVTGLDATTEFLGISGSESHQNKISAIRQTDFTGIRNIFSLAITFSNVRAIEDGAFSDLGGLSVLNLANNDIQELTTNTFQGLSRLTSLDLSGNKNCGFNKTLFRHFGSLQHLNLGDMNIKVLSNGLFDFVPKLKRLWLYMNGISKLPTDVLAPLTDLEYLDISSNQLFGLQVELKPYFLMIQNLNLGENPWQCNCQLLWLRDIPGNVVHSAADSKEVVCHSPTNLKYVSFSTVPDNKFLCVSIKIRDCENVSHSLEVKKTVLLSCAFEGDPKPEVKWTRPDGFEIVGRGTVKGNYEVFWNGTLFINHVTGYDHGEWIVSAYNKTTRVDQRIKINVMTLSTSTAAYASESLSPGNSFISTVSTSTTTKKSSTTFKFITSEAPVSITSTFAAGDGKSRSARLSCSMCFPVMTMLILCVLGKI